MGNQRKQRLATYGVLAIATLLCSCLLSLGFPALHPPALATTPATTVATTDPATLLQQGRSYYENGQLAAAVAVLQQAIQRYEQQADPLRQALGLSNLSLVYQALGQMTAANDSLQTSMQLLESAPIQESSDRLHILAQTLEIRAELQLQQGQAEPALATLQQAETLYTRLNDAPGKMRSRINQAQAWQQLGFYRRALDLLLEQQAVLQNQPDSLLKVAQLRSLGDALQLTGDLAPSRQVLQSSLAIAERLHSAMPSRRESPQAISEVLLSLGNTARLQAEWAEAIAFYQRAANTATDSLIQVQAKINALSLQVQMGESIAAQVPPIVRQLNALPSGQATIYAQVQFSEVLMQAGSYTEVAARQLAIATHQSRQLQDPRTAAYALGTLAHLYEQTGQWNDAQTLTQQALQLLQNIDAPEIAYRWHWQLGRLLKRQGAIAPAIAAYDVAVSQLEGLRKDLVAVNREVQFSFRDRVEPVYRESVALLLQSNGGNPAESVLDKARQRMEALQLAELDNFFREACLDTTAVLLDQVVDQDNPRSAILYPILLPEALQVIVKIPQQPLRHYTISQSQANVEAIALQLRQMITEPDTLEEVKTLSQQLYEWLVQPIESDLKESQVDTLVFVPDGALRSVPMAVLYDGEQYLVERYAIALSPGLELIRPQPLSTQRLQILAAGLVQPPADFSSFPPLPEIRAEFDLIAKVGSPMTTLLDQRFTQQTLEQNVAATAFNVVHLATHGQFSSRAEDTFVLAADGPINVTQFDALLRRRTDARPTPIELLVLSACQTAAGDRRATLGLAGVAVRAGARSTLASLWNVGDRSTALLMGEFYRQLTSAPITKAEALRQAQLMLLKNYPNYSRPGFWAAYVLIGNWL